MNKKLFWGIVVTAIIIFGMLFFSMKKESVKEESPKTDNNAKWQEAVHTPYGKYPETVTYTLGKISGGNHSNLPAGDTYEAVSYTHLKSFSGHRILSRFMVHGSIYSSICYFD